MYKIEGTFDNGDSINERYNIAIRNPNRKMSIRIGDPSDDVGDSYINESNISNLSISYSLTEDSDFEFGIFSCASVSLTLKRGVSIWEGSKFTIYSTLVVEDSHGNEHNVEVKIGTFYANDINRDNISQSVTAYDIAYYYGQYNIKKEDLDEKLKNDGSNYLLVSDIIDCINDSSDYASKLMTMYGPANDLIDKSKLNASTLNSKVYQDPESLSKLTFRQIIGYIAGFTGQYARINRDGILEFFSLNDTGISYDWNVFGDFRKYDYEMELDRLECVSNVQGFEDVTISTVGGYNVYKFENPLITSETELDAILNNKSNMIKGLRYSPCEFKLQGDPRLEIGDFITLKTRERSSYNSDDYEKVLVPVKIPIMDMTIRLNNGCMLEIQSVSDKDRKREYYVGGTLSDQLKYLRSQLEKVESGDSGAISDIKKEVEESRGYDSDGNPNAKLSDRFANIDTLISNKVSTGELNSNYITAKEIESQYVKTNKLEADYINAKEIEAEYVKTEKLETEYLSAVNADIQNLTADVADINLLKADKAEINDLSANVATIKQLYATKAEIDDLYAKKAYVVDLTAEKANISDLNAVKANITDLQAETAKIGNLTADIANINTAIIKKADIEDLNATNAKITNLNASVANIETLYATKAEVKELDAEVINTSKLNAEQIVTDKLNAFKVTADRIDAGIITADKLDANSIKTDILDSYQINANNITSGFIKGELIEAGSITADQLATNILDSEHIMAGSINANHIATGTIGADKIMAGSINANHIATGSITADHLATGTITADKIDTTDLVAKHITADSILAAWGGIKDLGVQGANIKIIDSDYIKSGIITSELISTDGLTANVIKGGILSLSDGLKICDADLQVPGSKGGISIESKRITIREPMGTEEQLSYNPTLLGNVRVQIGKYNEDNVDGANENNYGIIIAGYKRNKNGDLELKDGKPQYGVIFDSDTGLNGEWGIQSKTISTDKIQKDAITSELINNNAITDSKLDLNSLFKDTDKEKSEFIKLFIPKVQTVELNASKITSGLIETERIRGAVTFDSIKEDDPLRQVFVYDPDSETTMIDGNKIHTGYVYASKLILDNEFSVINNETGRVTFAVKNNGDVVTSGSLSSNGVISDNAIDTLGNGFVIKSSGQANFKTIDLNTNGYISSGISGLTNVVGTSKGSVLWAGATYSNKDTAPFRVDSNGNLNAKNISTNNVTCVDANIGNDIIINDAGLTLGNYSFHKNGSIVGSGLKIGNYVSSDGSCLNSQYFSTKYADNTTYTTLGTRGVTFTSTSKSSAIQSDGNGRILFNAGTNKISSTSIPSLNNYDFIFGDYSYDENTKISELGFESDVMVNGDIAVRSISFIDKEENSFNENNESTKSSDRSAIMFENGCLNIY